MFLSDWLAPFISLESARNVHGSWNSFLHLLEYHLIIIIIIIVIIIIIIIIIVIIIIIIIIIIIKTRTEWDFKEKYLDTISQSKTFGN